MRVIRSIKESSNVAELYFSDEDTISNFIANTSQLLEFLNNYQLGDTVILQGANPNLAYMWTGGSDAGSVVFSLYNGDAALFLSLSAHTARTDNPHLVNPSQLFYGQVSLTPSGDSLTQNSASSWNGKDVLANLTNATTAYTINFQSANFVDGACCNLYISANPSTIDVTITTDIGSILSKGSKVKMRDVGGWVTVQRHGSVLNLIGALKA